MATDTVAGDDAGSVMWMREKWQDQMGRLYGSDRSPVLHPQPEGMEDVVAEIKEVQAIRAKSEHLYPLRVHPCCVTCCCCRSVLVSAACQSMGLFCDNALPIAGGPSGWNFGCCR